MDDVVLMAVLKQNREKIEQLIKIGVLEVCNNVRDHNVGASDYAEKVIQPWSVWIDWELDAWDADIVKRIARHKEGESEERKYLKIKHICDEKLRQIDVERKFKQ